MHKKSGEGPSKRKPMTVIGLIILSILMLGVVVPLVMALLGSSGYEINAEGVYLLEGKRWKKLDLGGHPWLPEKDHNYVIYFRNLKCPHCAEFDRYWVEFLDKYSHDINATFVQVVCTYFILACSDPTAIATFNAFQVSFSPLLVITSDTKLLYYGVPPFNSTELYTFTTSVLSKAAEEENASASSG